MRISVLGDLLLEDDHGRVIDFGEGQRRQRRVRNLLCVLALHDRPVPSRRLQSLLWDPDGSDRTSMLTTLVHKVRKLLPPHRLVSEPGTRGGYRLVRSPADDHDVDRFRSALALAHRARETNDLERAAHVLDGALRLWRAEPGEHPLPDLPDTFAMRPQIEALLIQRRQASETFTQVELELGRHGPHLAERISMFIMDDPTNERLHGLRMLTLYRMGNRTEALLAYREAAATIDRVLDAPPGPDLDDLRRRISDNDVSLR